jgi:HK97 family phage major capsid protein
MTEQEMQAKIESINAANNKIISDFQADNDRKLKGLITEAAFSDLKTTYEKRFNEQDLELAKLKQPKIEAADQGPTLHTKAYGKYLRNQTLSPDEVKVLTIADSTHAGVLAPPEYVNQIIHYATLQHPMRTVATVRQTTQERVYFPTETAIGVATWEAESATKSETTGLTYALTTIIPQEIKILYKATQKMLEDSMFNLEAEIAQAVGRAFGTLEGTAFYSGNGTTTGPEGIVTNSTVAADANPLNTHNTLTFDDFLETQYLLASPYVTGASWLMNRATLGSLLALKSATTAMYLVQPNLTQGQPSQILGSPVYEWSAVTAWAATNSQIIAAYGDFRQGYAVIDRVGLTIQRLNELYAADGMIGFYARARVGGGVILPEAIQLLKNTAS